MFGGHTWSNLDLIKIVFWVIYFNLISSKLFYPKVFTPAIISAIKLKTSFNILQGQTWPDLVL